jgi:uncharacterized membrane protein YgaE (UPF0421/DUF939 family)
MPAFTVGTYPWTIGAIIAIVVLVVGFLGLIGVVPLTATVVFGAITALAVARLT